MSPLRGVGVGFLAIVAIFCLLGPVSTGREFATVYPDYVRARPSLVSHPTAAEARAALLRVAGRMRVKANDIAIAGGQVRATLVGDRVIDLRALVYFERSDAFGRAKVLKSNADGREIGVAVPLKRLWLPLGADPNGRDLSARLMLAGRVSLLVGVLGSAVALGVGVTYGMIAGYAGGRTDLGMMRVVDALYALPFIFFVTLLTAFFGRRFLLIFIAIGMVEWLDMARLARGQTLSLKSREFVLAARSLGVASPAILARHIAPNIAGVVLAYLAVLAPRVILVESFLSFLGLGVREPLTSLGVLVAEGARHLQDAPWLLIAPVTLLMLLLYGLAFLGESDAPPRRER
jgi:oligopeptide transport system permease protein